MLMNTRKDESGIILVALLFLLAILIFGFVVINSISKSREADQVRESAGDAINAAQDTVEAVNDVRQKAEDIINQLFILKAADKLYNQSKLNRKYNMGGRKSITNHIRKLGKTGNVDSPSYFITIPIDIVRAMEWGDSQSVRVKKSRGKVVIETHEENELETSLNDD